MNNKIGNTILNARKKKKISQEDMSRALNVSRQTISNWENGKSLPDKEMLKPICDFLNIDYKELQSKELLAAFQIDELLNIEKQKLKRKYNKVYFLFIIILIIVIGLFISILNHNTFSVYYVNSNNAIFNIDSIFIYSKVKKELFIGTIQSSLNKKYKYNLKLYQIRNGKERIIIEKEYEDNMIISENYGYNEYFDDDFLNYLNATYLNIQYYDNEWKVVTLKLEFILDFKSNKLFYFPVKSISKKDNKNNIYKNTVLKKAKLLKNNYVYNLEDNDYRKRIKDSEFFYNEDTNRLNYGITEQEKNTTISYDIDTGLIEGYIFNSSKNQYFLNFSYNVNTKDITCLSTNCNNFEKYVNLILDEVKKLQ